MLDWRGDKPFIKIIDFGFALDRQKVYNEAYQDMLKRNTVGTLAYLSPEVLIKRGDGIGHPQDVWALGVATYGLLACKYPFYNSNDMKLEKLIKTCDYQFKPSDKWANVSRQC